MPPLLRPAKAGLRKSKAMKKNKRKKFFYDAIVVLGAVMWWNKRKKRWEFPVIIRSCPGKLVMGQMRALATARIHNLAEKILVTGGSDKHPETGQIVSRSKQLAKLIVKRYGVPQKTVIAIGSPKTSHTLGNIKNLVKYLKKHSKILKSRYLAILCPRFQCRRAKMMFGLNHYFKNQGIKFDWLMVEDILEKNDRRYKTLINKIYHSPEAEICQKLEQKGVKDLLADRYKPAGDK